MYEGCTVRPVHMLKPAISFAAQQWSFHARTLATCKTINVIYFTDFKLNAKGFEVVDHGLTKFGIIPSVTFVVDIPEDVKKSWYNGQALF